MRYSFSMKELKCENGSRFKDGDIIEISDSHFEIWILYDRFKTPALCSRVFDLNRLKFQDIVFRTNYISDFLHR